MAYEVLARKWRPRQFQDVVGQDHVIQTLTNAIQTNRVAHAYLFVGPRGIGKTSIARIFAKALNCKEGMTPTPCDHCDACNEITAGSSLDVHELDAASNRGIDEIRALRDTIKYMPTQRFKIYIIDEVHMLTMEAFNALLKTLEEPPAHIKFFMATTEPQKIPATILSRCQRFDLRRIPAGLLIERLRLIAQSEGVTIDDDAVLAVARAAEGGLRDAESALDQLISFQGKDIHEQDVLAVFGLVSRQTLETLSTALLQGDIAGVIQQVEALDKSGKDMQRLLLELLEHVRNLLVYLQAGIGLAALDLTPVQVAVLKAQASLTHADRLLRITDILMETMDRLPYALSKKTLLETALIRCSRAAVVVSLDEIFRRIEELKHSLDDDIGGAPRASAAIAANLCTGISNHSGSHEPQLHPAGVGAVRENGNVAQPKKAGPSGDELAHLIKTWPELVEKVGKVVALAKGCLLDARPVAVVGDRVTIGFDPEFAARMEQAGLPRTRAALQKNLDNVLGRPITVEFKLLAERAASAEIESKETSGNPTGSARPPPARNVTHPPATLTRSDCGQGSVAGGPAGPPPKAGKPSLQQKQKWFKDPAVQKTMDMFNGDIQEVRE
ncbi:MAG: DNA polymerase III subunit gamma/tau [Verrucomicrobia bacterium]|nr:DNA polymerase III subunit gamma/tau [Verrucomicrobiota bacterium]MBU1735837.1 DNA polymerase III subunit gamma/tau [Verrucomicrobiota bacterium]MBU1857263.1 DNA polymerase III subunit gamma/tau [Verrucomicrobiota bacterium]